ncbi:RNA polymerase sigma-70 factor [Nakamurella lactea]|uniref:RNA polymerase sigma-70 factor n=1 Tax=Nakamurella lactea TaxID=459515 RepID=UPI0004050F1A|nr:RNA polymerase sigma-70 factor [Nakamurella lactea]
MTDSNGNETDSDTQFVALRPLLFSLGYQLTGSVADAEDIVSDAYLRLRRARDNGTEIGSLKNFLSTVVTRLGIDHLRSARVRRETYVGPWLPEPLVDTDERPEFERIELADTLSMAFLVLLETLTPTERAVFLLREVFEFDYPQIADTLGKSETHCRQLLTRARRHIDDGRPRFDADKRERELLADRFFAAVSDGELDPLVDLLAADVVAYGDGGGNGPSLPLPVNGRARVLKLLASLARFAGEYGLRLRRAPVNGQPGALVVDADGRLLNVLTIDIVDGAVQTVRSVVNPDKLRHLGPLIGTEHPLRGGGRPSPRRRGPAGRAAPEHTGTHPTARRSAESRMDE